LYQFLDIGGEMKDPMPLSQLPDYMKSARENGQEDIPVVDMGRIVSSREPKKLSFTYVTIACLFLSLGLAYVVNSTREITIVSNASLSEVSEIVSQEGGRVISAKEDSGKYKVRILSISGFGSLLGKLRENKSFDSVE